MSQNTFGTKAKPPIVKVIAKAARIIIGLRPYLSAKLPQTGDKSAAVKAVLETAKPE